VHLKSREGILEHLKKDVRTVSDAIDAIQTLVSLPAG
jgi:hypothetical protein